MIEGNSVNVVVCQEKNSLALYLYTFVRIEKVNVLYIGMTIGLHFEWLLTPCWHCQMIGLMIS